MSNFTVNTSSIRKPSTGKLTYRGRHHRQLSVGIKNSSATYRNLSCDSNSDHPEFTKAAYIPTSNPRPKFLVSKQIEANLKEIIQKLPPKKIKVKNKQSIKREKESTDSEKLYTSFFILFKEIDPTINIRGLKVNPHEVMLNYLSFPSKVEKTLEKTDFCLKNNRITDRNLHIGTLFQSHSFFSNIHTESLTTSKILYTLLSTIFEYCGIEHKDSVLQPVNSLILAKSTLQMIKTAQQINCTKPVNKENFLFRTAETEKPEKVFSDVTYLMETPSRPPRISQKYLESISHRNSKPQSAACLVLRPQVIS